MDGTNVVKDAVLNGEVERNEEDLGNDDEPLDPWETGIHAGADGEVDAEENERDEHPLLSEDLPGDREGREETGKVSGVCAKDWRDIHDPQKEPCVPIERPCQHYPKAQQKAESWEDHIQDNGDQPISNCGRTSPLGHQAHMRGVHAASLVVIDDGGDLTRMSVEGLMYQPGHTGEGRRR